MVAFLAILVIYEVASAVITSVRSVQVLNRGGPWSLQRKSLTFLVLRDGAPLFWIFSWFVSLCHFAAGLIYFGWDSDPSVFLGYVVNVSKSDSSLH